jgi:hypothetical protein
VRLFVLGDDVPVDQAAAALPLEAAGPLLDRRSDAVTAVVDLNPYGDETHDWYVVSDRTDDAGRPRREDHVLGVGGAAATLARLTVREAVGSALDVGTGCGVQALHLATHAATVTATDAVPRALALAATTFALSDVAVERRLGDLVAPVDGREFDLVVCNPPFVVGSPDPLAYRDGAWSDRRREGDELSRAAVRAAASVLAAGGVAQLLVNWLHVSGEDWRDRVAGWVADLGCDAWLLQRDAQDPMDYVRTWSADAGDDDPGRHARWAEWFRSRDVDAVGLGWVLLRRAPAPQRVAVEELLHPVDQPLGHRFADWLAATAWLRGRGDEDLLGTPFRVAPDVRLDTASVVGGSGWEPVARRLTVDGGLRWALPCDEPTAALVAGCDGSRPLHALVAVLELSTGIPRDSLVPAVCATVRGLVDRGVLVPPSA